MECSFRAYIILIDALAATNPDDEDIRAICGYLDGHSEDREYEDIIQTIKHNIDLTGWHADSADGVAHFTENGR